MEPKDTPAICVDGAYSSKTNVMQYRAVLMPEGREIFHKSFPCGTNNIAEFLAVVHALAHCKNESLSLPIYTDSLTALAWIRKMKAKTKLPVNATTKGLIAVVERAEAWLRANNYPNAIRKWQTDILGEIPADFGHK